MNYTFKAHIDKDKAEVGGVVISKSRLLYQPMGDRGASGGFDGGGPLPSKQALGAEHGVSAVTARCAGGERERGAGKPPPNGVTRAAFAANGEDVEHLTMRCRPERYSPGVDTERRTAAGVRRSKAVLAGTEHSLPGP